MNRHSNIQSAQDSSSEEIAYSLPVTEKGHKTNEESMLQALNQWLKNRNEKS